MKQNYSAVFSGWENKKITLKKAILGLSCLFVGANIANAQVSAYSFAQSTETFNAINGTALMTATGNTSATNLNSVVEELVFPTGFTFNFNGTNYTKVNVSSNGFITFGTTAPATTTTSPISGTLTYEGVISVFGRDLSSYYQLGANSSTGKVQYKIENPGINEELVIEWTNFRVNSSTSTTAVHDFSFQIRLEKGTNKIKMVYGPNELLLGTTTTTSTAQIGLRGTTTADYNNRYNTSSTAFVNSTLGTAAANTQYFSTSSTATSGMPPAGFTYTWTPPTCYVPKNVEVDTNSITTNSATISWLASTSSPANGYDVYYTSSTAAPDATTTPTISNVNNTTVNLAGLNANSYYYVYVRSSCSSSDSSVWSAPVLFTTSCGPVTNYYTGFENADSAAVVPSCWNRLVAATSPGTLLINSTTPADGSRNLQLYTSTTTSYTPSVAVLPVFSNLNAGTHWLKFRARITTAGTGTLVVGYVTDPNDLTTFSPIEEVYITNTSWNYPLDESQVIIPSDPDRPATARLAIKSKNEGKYIYIDELYWEAKPSCISPDNITVDTTTSDTATISWSASSSAPINGYDVYYSLDTTPPTPTTVANVSGILATSTTLLNLTPLTKYYVWVRSNCGAGDVSGWTLQTVSFSTKCQPNVVLTSTGASSCGGQPVTLTATTVSGSNIKWYDAATGGNLLETGNSFTTPSLTATTNYYVSASTPMNSFVGPEGPSSLTNGSSSTASSTFYVEFVVSNNPVTLISTDVFPVSAGQNSTVEILSGPTTFTTLYTQPFTTTVGDSNGTVYERVPLGWTLQPGTYRLKLTGGSYFRNYQSNAAFPYTQGDFSITTGTNVASNSYYFLYNLQVTSECESPRTMVTATLDANCLSTSEVEKKNQVKVYPNPFTDFVDINTPELVKTITVSDISGKALKTINQPESRLRLDSLSQGMYILLLEMKDGSKQSLKVIKK